MLSPESLAKIDRELTKYPAENRQAAVIAALHIAQVEHGWLSHELISYVAHYLRIPEIAAMEVATFYDMFNLKDEGKYKITVCTNISCMLRNSTAIVAHLKQRLGVDFDETTADGKFILKEGECMGACGGAPLMHVNNTSMYEFLTPDRIDEILEDLE